MERAWQARQFFEKMRGGIYNAGICLIMKIFIHQRKLVAENLTKHLTNSKKDEINSQFMTIISGLIFLNSFSNFHENLHDFLFPTDFFP